MAVYRKNNRAYSLGQPTSEIFTPPIISNRVPTTRDQSEIGQIWIYQDSSGTDDAYVLTSVTANSSAWLNLGGGNGSFDSLTVVGAATIGTTLTVTGLSTAGVVLNSAAGLLSTSTGTDAQVLMADTAAGLDFGGFTSSGGSIVLTYPAPHTINIEATGGTANSYVTDSGGPAAPLVGVLDVIGYDTNITTDGATANTVRIRLADDIVSVASITATDDFDMLAGTCTIISNDNSAQSILLNANAGVNETIELVASQGTSAASVLVRSLSGGVLLAGGLATADAVNISASDAAGGIDVDYGTGGMTVDGANGAFTLQTGTAKISLGTDAFAKDIDIGNATGATGLGLVSGTGNTVMTSTGTTLIDCAGVLELNSSAGIIGIGNDAVAQNINVGTGAAARTITIGNTSGASSTVIDVGTGNLDLGVSATAHTTTIGSVNTTSNLTLQSGTNPILVTAGGTFDLNAVGNVTFDSTGGTLGFGEGADAFNINIGTGAAARIINVGNITGATSVILNIGTGNLDLGVSATNHTTRLGSTSGSCDTTLQSGTNAMTFTAGGIFDANIATDITFDSAGGIFDVSVTGNMTFDSSAGTIGVGVDDIDQAINIGTAGERVITIGNQVGVAAITIESGSAGMAFNGLGLTTIELLEDTQAGAAVTVNANNGAGVFTGLTTAAAASQVFTITNSICTVNSRILVTVANAGANDAQMSLTRLIPGAGSFTVTAQNLGAASLNGDVIITFFIMKA